MQALTPCSTKRLLDILLREELLLVQEAESVKPGPPCFLTCATPPRVTMVRRGTRKLEGSGRVRLLLDLLLR